MPHTTTMTIGEFFDASAQALAVPGGRSSVVGILPIARRHLDHRDVLTWSRCTPLVRGPLGKESVICFAALRCVVHAKVLAFAVQSHERLVS